MANKDFVVKNGLVVSNSTLKIANSVGIVANNTTGLPGQVLTTNGTAVFWSTGTGNVNTSAQFTWNNTQFYGANLTILSAGDLVLNPGASIWAGGNKGTPGAVLMSDGENVYWGSGTGASLLKTNNLSDLTDKNAARSNLGIGPAATYGVGFGAGQVAPGDQTPSRTGAGASGTWGINITGSAGSFSSTVLNSQFNSIGVGIAPSGSAGDIRASGDVSAYATSDIRFKKNLKKIEKAIDKLMEISGYEYDWTEDYIISKGEVDGYFVRTHDVGVIAQEIEEILPEAVATRKNGVLAVNYDKIIPLLIESIKTLKLEIEELKKK